jgi:hypothetical protein
MLNQIYWLALGLVLGGMLGMAYGFGKASLRRQVTSEVPGLAGPGQQSTSSKVRTGWWAAWLQGVSTEMVGAVVTTILLGTVVGAVQQQLINEQKQDLVLQMGSPDHAFALEAARMIRARGWVFGEDTTLERAVLQGANLQGADLDRTNLKRADLRSASLQNAHLWEANLQGADLQSANLQGADLFFAKMQVADLREASLQGTNLRNASLEWANLEGAILRGANLLWADLQFANLQEADLRGVNLERANLSEANLEGVILSGNEFSETTTLPDGSKWKPDIDMSRFTNPEHPDFWRSDDPRSPAYRGNGDS